MGLSDPNFKLSRRERGCFGTVLGIFVLFIMIGLLPVGHMPRAQMSYWVLNSRVIALAMFQYSNDHGGSYPDGKSSTDVFQKLIDGDYITDPAVFYIPLPGKSKPVAGAPLKPENVSWDVTAGVEPNTPGEVPLVFMTGYRVTYAPGANAVPLLKPYPDFGDRPRTWIEWWHGAPAPRRHSAPGIAVCYSDHSAMYINLYPTPNSGFIIPTFVPASFDPKGRVYRQLTPDGPLP